MAETSDTSRRPFDRAPGDGRAVQDAIARGVTTRAARLDASRVRSQGERYRVFSALRLEAALPELVEADRRRGSRLSSPVDGLFVTIKGNIPRRGMPWTEGSAAFRDRVSDVTAPALARLEAAGAVTIGCTTLTELAMYAPDNPFEPLALNPWSVLRTPGGSSSGAGVAAALGLAEINLGTDSGGSIRNPAIHCGAFGFKPSLDRWSLEGVARYAPDLDTLGVTCRSIDDVIATDEMLSEVEARSHSGPVRLRVPQHLLSICDLSTRKLFDDALRRLSESGFAIEPIAFDAWLDGQAAAGVVSRYQSSRRVGPDLRGRLSPSLAARLGQADGISESEAVAALATCAAFQRELAARLQPGDVVISPGWPFRAPRIFQTYVVVAGKRIPMDPTRNVFVRAANAARAPALVLPAGFYPGRIPFGLQLMAEEGADARVLEAGRAVARHLPIGVGSALTNGEDDESGV